jgi:Ca2+/Na+ antiporter
MIERLYALVFGMLVAVQAGIVIATTMLVVMFVGAMWERSPWRAVAAVVVLAVVIVGLFRAWRQETGAGVGIEPHPGPSISRIPLSGSMGAVYLLQFLVWVLLIPGVGLFYLVLICGGVLLVPVVSYVNRSSRHRAGHVATGGVVTVIALLLLASIASARELPAAALFGVAVVGGVVAAAGLIMWRRRQGHPTIAPYVK